tara:strand:- start:1267 stop:2247 length:981 start_codon:yes stop_codon:yes gene_type:complete
MIYKSYIVEQNISGLDKNIFLFYGENLGLKNDFKKKIKELDKNLISYSQEEILKDEEKFYREVFNISLFLNNKSFYIDNVNDQILKLIQDIENKIDTHKIYLFTENLDKRSKLRDYFEKSNNIGIVACYNDNEQTIKKIILDQLKGFEGLTTVNINIIIENSNLSRIVLNNELNKIKIYFSNKKIVTEELLNLLNKKENDDFNILKDAALAGDKNKTNKLLSVTVLEKEKIIFYINTINQRLNKINDILNLNAPSFQIALDKIKPPIFWKDKPIVLNQIKKWNSHKIQEILKNTFMLEKKFKSDSFIDTSILMRKLVLDICNHANS